MREFSYTNFLCMSEMGMNKATADNTDFKRFISTCCNELRSSRSTVCFTHEHIEALKKKFDIIYSLSDGIYYVRLKGVPKNGFKRSKII